MLVGLEPHSLVRAYPLGISHANHPNGSRNQNHELDMLQLISSQTTVSRRPYAHIPGIPFPFAYSQDTNEPRQHGVEFMLTKLSGQKRFENKRDLLHELESVNGHLLQVVMTPFL